MAQEIFLDEIADAQEAVRSVVAELQAGQIVCLPDECGWLLAGLATCQSAAESMQANLHAAPRLISAVAIAHPSVLADYVTDPPRLLSKLSVRCWPGPLVLRGGAPESQGLARQWPAAARKWASTAAGRAFYCPAESFTREVLRCISSPVLCLLGQHRDGPLPSELPSPPSLNVRARTPRFSEGPTVVAVGRQQFQVERAGVVSERMLARLAGEVYLFVCTGNTCRSPMAESLFRKMLADRLKCREDELLDRGYVVISAGLAAYKGAAASPEAVELLRQEGIDLSGHESQPVTEELLFHCDHILTMTRSHRDAVLSAYPELAEQVRLLSPEGRDVSDPIGAGMEEYVRCRDEIARYLEQMLAGIGPRGNEGM